MPGSQLSRRHFSIRAREGHRKLKDGSKKAAANWWTDFVDPRLVPVKVTFFFIMGATQCTAPYSTLLMKALGLSMEETAIIFTIGPLIPIVAPFLAGIMTDKIGNFRVNGLFNCVHNGEGFKVTGSQAHSEFCSTFLAVTVALSGILSLFHVAIPPARTKLVLNDTPVDFELTCKDRTFQLSYAEAHKCSAPLKPVIVDTISVTNCGYLCLSPVVEVDYVSLDKENPFVVTNFWNDSYSLNCEVGVSNKQKCVANNLNFTQNTDSKRFTLREVELDFPKTLRTGKMVSHTLNSFMMTPSEAASYDCNSGELSKDISLRKMFISKKNNESTDSANPAYVNCVFHCEGSLPINSTCENTTVTVTHDVSLSFWLFVAAKVISAFMTGLTYSMFEAGVVAIMKKNNNDYGLQRIYGSIGGMMFAPLTGYIVDCFGGGKHYSDYYVCYYLFCGLKLLCALILTRLDLKFRSPARSICGNIAEIFTNIETMLLILIVFVSGMCYGFIEHFLPWHIQNLGAENWMIGLMTTVASISAVPFLAVSDFMCRKFGHIQCISFGLICYSVRCFGYSLLTNPFWCFPFEVLEGITTGLLVAAAIIYGAKLSDQSNLGTLQGMLATFHYGFGKSAGSLLGGFMMAHWGPRAAFKTFGGGSFLIAFFYYLFYKLKLKKRHTNIDKMQRDVLAMPVAVIPKESFDEELNMCEETPNGATGRFPVTSTPQKKNEVF